MLTLSSIRHYRAYYRLFAVAVIIMMAVVVGSLLLGDSVRGTLRDRVYERLGRTETLITSGTGFFDIAIMESPLLQDAEGYLMLDGFVSSEGRMIPVQVFGTDEDSTFVGEPLFRELHGATDIVLHLPAHTLVPSGSLFVTQSYSTQLRLTVDGIRSKEQGGNLLLRNEQVLPLNVFVSRRTLADLMELPDRINLILSPDFITEQQFRDIWHPSLSGIRVHGHRLTSDRIFLEQATVDAVRPSCRSMAYLVNDITMDNDTVPYSFATAVDNWGGRRMEGDDIILSADAAERLSCQVGDTVGMSYFVSQDLKTLQTDGRLFVVRDIVPRTLLQDSLLMADFPGLSNVESCTDWDSDLPIQMDRIQRTDEDDWYRWHQTPKALVPYETMRTAWSSSYGVATALEVDDVQNSLSRLDYPDLGVMLVHPVQSALEAAASGTDFASLFLALGFFIILSGILLMLSPLWEMLAKRRQELQLLSALGFTEQRVRHLLWRECLLVLLLASPIGVLAGWAYSGTTLYLLGNVWSGATHTEGFSLHANCLTLFAGWGFSLLLAVTMVGWGIRRASRQPAGVVPEKSTGSRYPLLAGIVTAAFIVIMCYALLSGTSIVLFVVSGLLWLLMAALWGSVIIGRRAEARPFSRISWMWQSLRADRSQNLLSFWSLSTGVFIVFAVGLSRPDFTNASGEAELTGCYQLWCDSRIPLQYDLNIPQVRRKLHLQDLDTADVRFLQLMRHRMDEASCLNLNRVTTPTVLGVDAEQLARQFRIDLPERFTRLDTDSLTGKRIARIIIDSESLTWSLMRQVGDTLCYTARDGADILLVIAGRYPTGIFHGQALMDRTVFRCLWPDDGGTSLLLVTTPEGEEQRVKQLMQTALSGYGLDIVTTAQRIELFFSVTDTYLSIFLTMGGLGLLLGIFCLIIGVRKSLVSRHSEMAQLTAVGFPADVLEKHLLHEHLVVPLYAIATGTSGAVISISANVTGAGPWTLLTALVVCLALFLLTIISIRHLTQSAVTHTPFWQETNNN